MKSIRKALACLRQIRWGRTNECGWIADGSSHWSKCAIGVCVGVQASRNGITLLIRGCHLKTGKPVMTGKGSRINWRLPESVVRLILGTLFAEDCPFRLPVPIQATNRQIEKVRGGESTYRPTYQYVTYSALPPC